jgi:hypothetical protein
MRAAMMTHARLIAIVVLVAACVARPGPTPAPPPSEVEARAYLDSVVAVIESGNVGGICELGPGTCESFLDGTDPATIPTTRPHVVSTRVLESRQVEGGGWQAGGRILEICGIDGLGHRYDSEILVFRSGGELIGIQPVFWTGMRIAEGDTTEPGPRRPPGDCPPQG